MPMYRKKPDLIEARCLLPDLAVDIAHWCGGQLIEEIDALDSDKKYVGINVPTFSNASRASEGDYLVKDANGMFTVIKASDFESEYEEV